MPGRLLVHRKGVKGRTYRVPAKTFTQHRDGHVVTVHRPAQTIHRKGTGPTTFSIRDLGKPGRGPKLIQIKHPGYMTRTARDLGYIRGDMKVSDIPDSRIDDFARALARKTGARKAFGMFQAQVNYRKNATGAQLAVRRKFEKGRDAIARAYGSELAPTEAIRSNLRRGRNPHGPG